MSTPVPPGGGPLRPLSDLEWTALQDRHPAFGAAARAHVAGVAASEHLDPAVKALVALVVDAAVTHLHRGGMERHVAAALDAGATAGQVGEALECASTLSIHAVNFGLPVLVDVLAARGGHPAPPPLDERRRRLRDDFTARRGYWNSTWDEVLVHAPDFFETYTELSSVPWDTGHLSPLVRELLYVAFDTSATHLYGVGLRLHLENALDLGATVGQLVEVMQIASLIGLRAAGEGGNALEAALQDGTRHRPGGPPTSGDGGARSGSASAPGP